MTTLPILLDWKLYWFHVGRFGVGYYSAFFALAVVLGSLAWAWQAKRGGYPKSVYLGWLLLGVPVCILGARLGHCLFYQPGYFLSHPALIPQVWRRGLSSHGLTAAIFAFLVIMARIKRYPVWDIVDRFMFSVVAIIVCIRLGNFFNQEIVGRVTDVPWAVRFARFDGGHTARHPVQLYEALLGLVVLAALLYADARTGKERRPRGLMTGLAAVIYFGGRFLLEFFKELQVFSPGAVLTEGQYLSIPWILSGAAVLVWVWRRARRTAA
jgi:phosphatidylglycerol---prolipoprotein diacylglyceryl transferase